MRITSCPIGQSVVIALPARCSIRGGEAGLLNISSGSVDGLREVEDCGGELRIRGTEREPVRAAPAADVEQPFSAAEGDPLGHQARRTERSSMLCRAELSPPIPAL